MLKKTRLGKGFRVLKKKEMFKRVFSPIKWVILPLFNDPVVLWLKHFLKDKLPQFRNVDQPHLNIMIHAGFTLLFYISVLPQITSSRSSTIDGAAPILLIVLTLTIPLFNWTLEKKDDVLQNQRATCDFSIVWINMVKTITIKGF